MTNLFHETREGVTFAVKVIPRAKRDEMVGIENDALKIRLNAPPVEGRANEALVKFLAQTLNIARANVEIVRGETSRNKVVRVRNMTAAQVNELLIISR
ncbi:MAG: YggU family protein [Chloroflexota bacterium]|nr:MAG: YggU family protein [Chloroflexota bacterium]